MVITSTSAIKDAEQPKGGIFIANLVKQSQRRNAAPVNLDGKCAEYMDAESTDQELRLTDK